MEKILELFEKALSEYHATAGKKDNLVGCGEILVLEFKKQRESIITLGQLLADFYAQERQEQRRVYTLTTSERTQQQFDQQLRNQDPRKL